MEGTVKWFNNKKGYGFVSGEDGQEYFVHYTALPQGLRLRENDIISFDSADSERGKQAQNVALAKKASERTDLPDEESNETPAISEQPPMDKEETEEKSESDETPAISEQPPMDKEETEEKSESDEAPVISEQPPMDKEETEEKSESEESPVIEETSEKTETSE